MTNEQNDTTVHHGTVEGGPKSLWAYFAYFWILLIIPFIAGKSKDPFVKFHLKQGLALLGFELIGWIISILIGGSSLGNLMTSLWNIITIVLIVVGIINVSQGREKELPLIGQYGNSFKF